MAQFTYQNYDDPMRGTIAELIARQNDPRARAAQQIGQAQARAAENIGAANANAAQQSGNAWAGAVQNVGQSIAGIPGAIQQGEAQWQGAALRQIALENAQRQQAGQKAVSGLMSGGDQMRPGDAGPQQESYLDSNGLFDVAKITKAVGQLGYGDMAPELLKGAESINDSILKHQALETQAAQQHAILLGDLAAGALKLTKTGTPLDAALDFVVQPALATKRFKPEEYAQVKQQILSMPPEQQQAALGALMDQAAKLGGGKTLADGAQEVDRYGRTVAENVRVEIGKGDYTINGQRFKADGTPIGAQVVPPETPAQKAANELAQQARTETERHNKELERISSLSAGRAEASAAETARHNRASEESARNRVVARPMTSSDANKIAEIDNSIKDVYALTDAIGKTGASSRMGAALPDVVTEYTGLGENAKQRQAMIDRVKQVIGKALEGGVLRKEDEEKYKKILPTIGDPPAVAKTKLEGLQSALKRKRDSELENLADAGYNVEATTKRGAPVAPGAPATGTIRARDPQGVLHEAPAGTTLPAGWKLER